MGYYIRILSPSESVPSFAEVQAALAEANLAAKLEVEPEVDDDWTNMVVSQPHGTEITAIERNCASSNDLVEAEIEEFLAELKDALPASAAEWLAEYLPTVRTIYAFQILSGTYLPSGWEILGVVKDSMFAQVGGIIQADGEGFSNQDGYHILWQFADSVTGDWQMAVLQDGEWATFQMDLGNEEHRQAFWRGEVPAGLESDE